MRSPSPRDAKRPCSQPLMGRPPHHRRSDIGESQLIFAGLQLPAAIDEAHRLMEAIMARFLQMLWGTAAFLLMTANMMAAPRDHAQGVGARLRTVITTVASSSMAKS